MKGKIIFDRLMQLVLKLRISPQKSNKTHVCAGLYCYCGGRGFVFSPVVGVGDLGALELPPPNQPPPASPH